MSELDQSGPISHFFVSQRLRLHYVDWGNAQAPPLILLHGARDHARSWDWVARELRRDWHVIVPDLRGHGDSAWSPDGVYLEPYLIYDLAQFIHQLGVERVTIIAHSLGGGVALRYAGLYPLKLRKLVVIEGLRPASRKSQPESSKPHDQRMREWIDARRDLSSRAVRRFASIDAALERMRAQNPYLSEEQARHLTNEGVSQNEDGTYSWKFDHYIRSWTPLDISSEELYRLWGLITCPLLLCYGGSSWTTNPAQDGRMAHFRNASIVLLEQAGHWPHHDQFDQFMQAMRSFLSDV